MDLLSDIKDFMLTEAVSGYEKKMSRKLKARFEEYADEVIVDRAGNTMAKFQGTDSAAPRVMIFAHMDQLGFIVRKRPHSNRPFRGHPRKGPAGLERIGFHDRR